ncbi:39711_t:CDS:2 [Gigaspora margarita]|uniref:ribonuclease H n=1 Tax=Gigaspora margarita TaxID=4874 RepID=A0ABM8VXU9_GIGMA|nr:39711_t:CDS:2 [Gigaspora margarita]
MCPLDYFVANKKDRIDIIHYFKSLQDICASLLRCGKKKAENIINHIFEENELKKQHKITEFFRENEFQDKIITTDLKRKIPYDRENIKKKQQKIDHFFQKIKYLPNQKEQFMLGITCWRLWRNYLKVIQDSTVYKFVAYNPKKVYYEKDPILYEFKYINMNKNVIKRQDDKEVYGMVFFDKKNQHCVDCRKARLICDTEIECFHCKKNNIPCIKKKDFVRKRLYKNKEGVLYCKPLDEYWRTNNLLLIYKHINDIKELGKRICEKYNKRKFCCINAIINNNCCNIESCLSMNIVLKLVLKQQVLLSITIQFGKELEMKYIKFDGNILSCKVFNQIIKYYNTMQQTKKIISYLKENEFNQQVFDKILLLQKKHNELKTKTVSEFTYKFTIEYIDISYIILTETTTFQKHIYIIEHYKPGYYAVLNGRKKGIYKTWEECKAQVSKFPNAKFKKFYNIKEAQDFIEGKKNIVKNDPNSLQVWTDGSAFENGTTNTRAGIGVFWKDNDIQNLSEHVPGDQTNNRAEIYAVIRAIEICKDKVKPLNIMTDSKYVINAMKFWIKNWERNNYISYRNKPVKNSDLFKHLKSLIDYRIGAVKFVYVRGHMGNYGNEQADRLAKQDFKRKSHVNNFGNRFGITTSTLSVILACLGRACCVTFSEQVNHIITLIAWLRANNPGIGNPPEGWKPGDPVINSLSLSEVLEEQKKAWVRIYKNLGIINPDPNSPNAKSSTLFEAIERVSIDI